MSEENSGARHSKKSNPGAASCKSSGVDTDKGLGMDAGITRRDFVNATLAASGGLLLGSASPAELLARQSGSAMPDDDWTGYGGVGDYANSNGNTLPVMMAGHQIRDGRFASLPAEMVETGEIYDCVIVGGGISGLAAALIFSRLAGEGKTCLMLDNHPIFGGEAKRNEFVVDGQKVVAHQGSAFYPIPYPHSFIARFYESIGLKQPKLEYQEWAGPEPEIRLSRTPYLSGGKTSAFYFGAKFGHAEGLWLTDPWGKKLEGAPIPAEVRAELLRYNAGAVKVSDPKMRPPEYGGDEVSRWLDQITLQEYLMKKYEIRRETVREYLADEGSGYGLGADALSGYTAYAAEMLHPLDITDETGDQMFPGGNAGFARLITKTIIPQAIAGDSSVDAVCRGAVNFDALDRPGSRARMRLGATVVSVKHEGDPGKSDFVDLVYTREGKVCRVKARSVVMAGGSWTTRHIVRDLPADRRAAYRQFYRSPCLMANVAVRDWRFLYKMGLTGCQWFEGFGSYFQIRKQALCGVESQRFGPDSPTVLTLKVLYPYPGMSTEGQGNRGRGEMLATPFREYERKIREQLTMMFAAHGFEARRDIAGIILNRWGHAYLSPAPGFFFGKDGQPAPGEVLRAAPFGRIAFANTDLSGVMDHRYSIIEANRAVGQLLDQVVT